MANSSYRSYLHFVALGLVLMACKPVGLSGSKRRIAVGPKGNRVVILGGSARAPSASTHLSDRPVPSNQESGDQEASLPLSSSLVDADAAAYESVPLDEETKELLNIPAFERNLAGLSRKSRKRCARYVRYSLEKLFGANIGGQGDAYEYNAAVLNKFASKKGLLYEDFSSEQTPPFQDFDVRVSQPKKGGSTWGHIEIFYEGRWYSDFKQSRSLWDNDEDGSYYSSMKIYRLGKASPVSLMMENLEILASWIVPSAFAETVHKEEAPLRSVAAEARDQAGVEWKVEKIVAGEVPEFELYRSAAGKKTLVSRSAESFFLLLGEAASAVPATELANDFIQKWVARDGREAVQKRISKFTGLVEIQRDAYVRSGFELPVNYNLITPKK